MSFSAPKGIDKRHKDPTDSWHCAEPKYLTPESRKMQVRLYVFASELDEQRRCKMLIRSMRSGCTRQVRGTCLVRYTTYAYHLIRFDWGPGDLTYCRSCFSTFCSSSLCRKQKSIIRSCKWINLCPGLVRISLLKEISVTSSMTLIVLRLSHGTDSHCARGALAPSPFFLFQEIKAREPIRV